VLQARCSRKPQNQREWLRRRAGLAVPGTRGQVRVIGELVAAQVVQHPEQVYEEERRRGRRARSFFPCVAGAYDQG
jgi:hypothetical protein